ncbi:alpha-1,2-fucosyltransferase [Aeromonas sp. 164P]
MKVISISGGLGNQLFQYAFYLYLKDKSKFKDVFLDFSFYSNQSKRTAVIKNFHGINHIDIDNQSSYVRMKFFLLKFIGKFRFANNFFKFVDKEKGLDKTVLITSKMIFDGYWQSYEYAKNYRSHIKDLFGFYDFNGNVLDVKNMICKTNCICMHVRRGDYITESNASSVHGVCSELYYRDAFQHVYNADKSVECIFVFSDEIEWVKNNLSFEIPMIVVDFVGQDVPDYVEMLLFSHGKHKIISNSTFSWWGAFLSERSGLIVTPKKWFINEEKIYDEIFIKGSVRL